MPVTDETNSRFRNVPVFVDDRGEEVTGRTQDLVYYGTRIPFSYMDDDGTTVHVVKEGDTLHKLANTYYQGFRNPASLWWVIADFQRTPIVDPTLQLEAGTLLNIPSANLVGRLVNTSALDRIPL